MSQFSSPRKRLVGLDFDDTVVDTTGAVMRSIEQELGKSVEPGNISDFGYWESLGFSRVQALEFCADLEADGYPGIELIPGVDLLLEETKEESDFFIVTARRPVRQDVTLRTLATKGLDKFIKAIHHTQNPYYGGDLPTKAEMCLQLGLDVFIDNEVRHVNACHKVGVRSFLFGSQGFRDIDPHDGVVEIPDWTIGGAYLKGLL